MRFPRSLLALTALATVAAGPPWQGTPHHATVDILSTAEDGGVHGDGSPYVGDVDGSFEFIDRVGGTDEFRLGIGPGRSDRTQRTISVTLDGQPHTCAWTHWSVSDRSLQQLHADWYQLPTAQLGARMWCGGHGTRGTLQLTWTHRVADSSEGPSSEGPTGELVDGGGSDSDGPGCVSATRDGGTWTFEAGTDCVVELATWRRGAYRFDTTIVQPFRFRATRVSPG